MVGVTPVWDRVAGMTQPRDSSEAGSSPASPTEDNCSASIHETLRPYLRESLHRYWSGYKLKTFNAALAAGLQRLVASGITSIEALRNREGQWHIPLQDMPPREREALLQALEGAVSGSRRADW
eukprot:3202656-Rhodomonas_salina.1